MKLWPPYRVSHLEIFFFTKNKQNFNQRGRWPLISKIFCLTACSPFKTIPAEIKYYGPTKFILFGEHRGLMVFLSDWHSEGLQFESFLEKRKKR